MGVTRRARRIVEEMNMDLHPEKYSKEEWARELERRERSKAYYAKRNKRDMQFVLFLLSPFIIFLVFAAPIIGAAALFFAFILFLWSSEE